MGSVREIDLIKSGSIVYWHNPTRNKDDLFNVLAVTKDGKKFHLSNIRTGGKFSTEKYNVGLHYIQPGMQVRMRVGPVGSTVGAKHVETVTSMQYRNGGFAVFVGLEQGDGIPLKEFNEKYEILED